jgi:Fe-S cluster assembly ATP-binding protein
MLKVEDLHVAVGGKPILKGINIHIKPGETHVLFGPNGSGKSTLLGAVMGFTRYQITSGRIFFRGQDISSLSVAERAKKGIGIAFQRPPVLHGVMLGDLLKAVNGEQNDIDKMAVPLHMGSFLEINEKGTTVIIATHAKEIVDAMRQRVIALNCGQIVRDEQRGVYANAT